MRDHLSQSEATGPWRFGPGMQWTALSSAELLLCFGASDVHLIAVALGVDGSPEALDLLSRIEEVESR